MNNRLNQTTTNQSPEVQSPVTTRARGGMWGPRPAGSSGSSQSAKPPPGGSTGHPAQLPEGGTANRPQWRVTALLLAGLLCFVGAGCGRPETGPDTCPPAPPSIAADEALFTTMVRGEDEHGGEVVTIQLGPVERRLHDVLATATPELRDTATIVLQVAKSGEMAALRRLERRAVESLALHLAGELSTEAWSGLMAATLRLPLHPLATREDAVEMAMGVFDALAGNTTAATPLSSLVMTDACDLDGRVTGSTHVIPAGSRRVYAVFENDRSLAGYRKTFAVWRQPADDRIVFSETEPIHAGARYNYVWLDLAGGWPAGR